jgi:hypothetical protein
MSKKKWHRPKLIVLVKAKPEEAVLSVCKGTGSGPGGPGTLYFDCNSAPAICLECYTVISLAS